MGQIASRVRNSGSLLGVCCNTCSFTSLFSAARPSSIAAVRTPPAKRQDIALADQVSPGKNATFPCARAAFTVGTVPVGFAAMCQLASAFSTVSVCHRARLHYGWQPLTVLASFKRAGACVCKPRFHPSDKPSRPCPCLRLVVIMASS